MVTHKEQRFEKKYAKELLKIAEADLKAAHTLFAGDPGRDENIFFMIEQSIEKSIKSVICHLGEAIPLTHEITILLLKIPQEKAPPFVENLSSLTHFATVRRYETGSAIFSKEEINEALKMAASVLSWAKKEVG